MARLHLQAGCMLCVLLLAACAAMAADVGVSQQQQDAAAVPVAPTPAPANVTQATAAIQKQKKDSYDSSAYPKKRAHRWFDAFKGDDEGPDYAPYHHSDDFYAHDAVKVAATTILLQEASGSASPATNFTSSFRCARDADAADVCPEPDYGKRKPHELEHFLTDVAFASEAAACNITRVANRTCPSIVVTDCQVVRISCEIGSQACECGSPFGSGFRFSAVGFELNLNASSCEQQYNLPGQVGRRRSLQAASHAPNNNATCYQGVATIITAKLKYISTVFGHKEVKAKVEYVTNFRPRGVHGLSGEAATQSSTAYSHYDATGDDAYYNNRHYHDDDDDSDDEGYDWLPFAKKVRHADVDKSDRYHERRSGGRDWYGSDEGYGSDVEDTGPDSSCNRDLLVKGGNLKITLLEKQYY